MLPTEQDGSVTRLLDEGIQAARRGDKGQAQRLLLQVIEQDKRNEKAWLWLSGVVDTDEDRVVCLENVLSINPASLAARKGLERLQGAVKTAEPPPTPEPPRPEKVALKDNVVRVERPPISAAAAVLYPERQIMELPWDEKTELQTIPPIAFESRTAYNDIWEKESEICAFCAQELDYDEKVCPNCKKKLTSSYFRYPKASPGLINYFVLLVATAQMFFIRALVDLIVQTPLLTVVWDIFLFMVLFGLAVSVALRQFWAYTVSLLIMVLIFLTMILDISTGLGKINAVVFEGGQAYFQALAQNGFITMIRPLLDFIVPFQMLAIFLALVYGIFKAGPDFERVEERLVAKVDKSLNDASAFFDAGKRYGKEGMWASAVLHFQRAAAHEPNRAYYHLAAGKAFAQLGFKERAMDAYASAKRLASNPELKTEIELLITDVTM